MIDTARPKALIFDMDDTLIVEEASAEAAFLQTRELASARHRAARPARCEMASSFPMPKCAVRPN